MSTHTHTTYTHTIQRERERDTHTHAQAHTKSQRRGGQEEAADIQASHFHRFSFHLLSCICYTFFLSFFLLHSRNGQEDNADTQGRGGWPFLAFFFLLSLKDAVDKRILLTLGGLAILASVPLFLRRRVERSLEQVWCKGGRGCA
jgi:hypothetical protein